MDTIRAQVLLDTIRRRTALTEGAIKLANNCFDHPEIFTDEEIKEKYEDAERIVWAEQAYLSEFITMLTGEYTKIGNELKALEHKKINK